jgi:hypothetical protein
MRDPAGIRRNLDAMKARRFGVTQRIEPAGSGVARESGSSDRRAGARRNSERGQGMVKRGGTRGAQAAIAERRSSGG